MAATAFVRARMDETLKTEAANVLAEMGLTVSDVVRMTLTRIAKDGALPFELKAPNAETRAAMAESRAMMKAKGIRLTDIENKLPMLDIWSMSYTKENFARIPEDERVFHLMAGQLANEINILTKMIVIVHNYVGGEDLQNRAQITQTLYFIRQLAARLNQGWELIGEQFNPLYPRYEADLSAEAKDHLKMIKKYFGKSNILNAMRNKIVSHSDREVYSTGFNSLPDEAELIDYVAADRGHCLYFSSEFIGLVAMIKLTGASNWKAALDKVSEETVNMAVLMGDFVLEVMAVFMNRHFKNHPSQRFQIVAGPPIDKVQLPFFARSPAAWPSSPH